MVLAWDQESRSDRVVRRLPLAAVISPQFVRRREDKQVQPFDIRIQHPGLPQGGRSLQEVITIRTTYPKRRTHTMRAHLLVVHPIQAVPGRAVLGFVSAAGVQPPTHGARIRLVPADPDVSFRVVGYTFVGADGAPLGDGESGFTATSLTNWAQGVWVEIRYDGKQRQPGPLNATLVVRTDADELSEVRIACYATVRQ